MKALLYDLNEKYIGEINGITSVITGTDLEYEGEKYRIYSIQGGFPVILHVRAHEGTVLVVDERNGVDVGTIPLPVPEIGDRIRVGDRELEVTVAALPLSASEHFATVYAR